MPPCVYRGQDGSTLSWPDTVSIATVAGGLQLDEQTVAACDCPPPNPRTSMTIKCSDGSSPTPRWAVRTPPGYDIGIKG